jgi:septal ring factor EnvC (AmiA/AmiB activator)
MSRTAESYQASEDLRNRVSALEAELAELRRLLAESTRREAELMAENARLNGWLNLATESKLAVWAHCEQLREVLSESICSNEPCAELFCNTARSVLAETPAQSLEAIRAEERTAIEEIAREISNQYEMESTPAVAIEQLVNAIRARGAK